MFVGIMELHLAIIEHGSIKDKRSVVKRITHRCRNTFNVAINEVDEHDALDRAILGIVAVNNNKNYLQGQLDAVEQFVERLALAEVLEAPKLIENY
jgi:uncharacterized protein YlxP (DUF503 family)